MIRLAGLVWVALSLPAHAHGGLPGGGGFATGFAHPFVAVEHALAIAALGLLCRDLANRTAAAWLIIGLGIGFGIPDGSFGLEQAGILGLALATGAILALALEPPRLAFPLLALALGMLVGLETDQSVTTRSPAFAYAGTITAVLLLFLNSLALSTWLGARWNGVALRIAGSWIAAAAIMILAFLLNAKLGSP